MAQKSPDAFRTISEVSETLDIPAHVLRFWESKFSQIKPVKRGGGRRYYRPADVDLLRGIRDLLYSEGLTIKGVQKILRERGVRHVTLVGAGEVPAEAIPSDTGPSPDGDQRDLFESPEAAPEPSAAPPQSRVPRTVDRKRLRSVIGELEALRDRMKTDGDE